MIVFYYWSHQGITSVSGFLIKTQYLQEFQIFVLVVSNKVKNNNIDKFLLVYFNYKILERMDISLEEFQKIKSLDNKKIIVTIHYEMRDAASASTTFNRQFVENTIIIPLKNTFGSLGSAKFLVKLISCNEILQNVQIEVQAKLFAEYWAAFMLNRSVGNIVYKVSMKELRIIHEVQN